MKSKAAVLHWNWSRRSLDKSVTEQYALDDINKVMADLLAGNNIRGFIAFE